jgi:hypothetical protein
MIEWLPLILGVAAILYSAVGHGGASAYIALMALAGMAPTEIRPTALTLNLIVSGIAAARFMRAGQFDWRVFWPFAMTAVPAAFFAGRVDLPESTYKLLLGLALAAAAARYMVWPQLDATREKRVPAVPLALACGAALGALAGLTGIGGGVYLSPLLIFCGWARPKEAAGVAAAFIFVNSLAGFLGRAPTLGSYPDNVLAMGVAVLVGAAIGTTISLGAFTQQIIVRTLGIVLGVAAFSILL